MKSLWSSLDAVTHHAVFAVRGALSVSILLHVGLDGGNVCSLHLRQLLSIFEEEKSRHRTDSILTRSLLKNTREEANQNNRLTNRSSQLESSKNSRCKQQIRC